MHPRLKLSPIFSNQPVQAKLHRFLEPLIQYIKSAGKVGAFA